MVFTSNNLSPVIFFDYNDYNDYIDYTDYTDYTELRVVSPAGISYPSAWSDL